MADFLFLISIFAAKAAVVLVYVFLMYRFLGKRQAGQMNVYDIVLIVCLANAVQNAMTEGKGILGIGLTAATTLVIVSRLLAKLATRSPSAYKILVGHPTVLISQGVVSEAELRRQHVSREELMATLRQHGFTSVQEVSMAVLEVDGTINIVPTDPAR